MSDQQNTQNTQNTQIVVYQHPSPPPILSLFTFNLLKFHFSHFPARMLPWSQNDYPEMNIKPISENEISTDHEFYEEFMDLFEKSTSPVYVPITYPKITSFNDVLRATNIIYPHGLENTRIRIALHKQTRLITNLSDPSQETIQLPS